MHSMLKRSASFAAAVVVLAAAAVGAVAQDDGGEEPPPGVPLPEECVVEPRAQDEIDAILAAGANVIVLPDGLPVPLGTPADADTRFAVEESVYELVACLNAGETARGAALFSENGLRGFYGAPPAEGAAAEPAGTPIPRTEEQWLRLRSVTDISLLGDGRAAAFVIVDDPLLRGRAQTLLFVFVNEGGVWYIDGTVGFSAIGSAATPTP